MKKTSGSRSKGRDVKDKKDELDPVSERRVKAALSSLFGAELADYLASCLVAELLSFFAAEGENEAEGMPTEIAGEEETEDSEAAWKPPTPEDIMAVLIEYVPEENTPEDTEDFEDTAVTIASIIRTWAKQTHGIMEPEEDDEDENVESGCCEMCERGPMPLTRHHLIPRSTHKKYRKLGYDGLFLNTHLAIICRSCHSAAHRAHDNETLARDFNTVEKLLEDEKVLKFVSWIRKQPIRTRRQLKPAR